MMPAIIHQNSFQMQSSQHCRNWTYLLNLMIVIGIALQTFTTVVTNAHITAQSVSIGQHPIIWAMKVDKPARLTTAFQAKKIFINSSFLISSLSHPFLLANYSI